MTSVLLQILRRGANDHWRLNLSDKQLAQFEQYAALLSDWNETRFNLTRIVSPQGVAVKHFLDSLAMLTMIDIPLGARVIDVGTGAGLPGLALRIARPDLRLTLLDATAKKLAFCRTVADDLVLENVQIVHARAEDACKQSSSAGAYDIAVARAVAPLEKLLFWTVPFLNAGGTLIALKGAGVESEMPAAQAAARRLKMILRPPVAIPLPEADEPTVRQIVIGRKARP